VLVPFQPPPAAAVDVVIYVVPSVAGDRGYGVIRDIIGRTCGCLAYRTLRSACCGTNRPAIAYAPATAAADPADASRRETRIVTQARRRLLVHLAIRHAPPIARRAKGQ